MTALADRVLHGLVPDDFHQELPCFPAIEGFLDRLALGAAAETPDDELTALAHDLIRATAARDRRVGAAPIQTAILRRGHAVEYDQPIHSAGDIILPADGTWHMGVVVASDSDYPFITQRGTVFTDCEVTRNRSPLLLGGNLFFGSRLVKAMFRYDGGRVIFGSNNELIDCELQVAAGAPGEPWSSIRQQFARVVYE